MEQPLPRLRLCKLCAKCVQTVYKLCANYVQTVCKLWSSSVQTGWHYFKYVKGWHLEDERSNSVLGTDRQTWWLRDEETQTNFGFETQLRRTKLFEYPWSGNGALGHHIYTLQTPFNWKKRTWFSRKGTYLTAWYYQTDLQLSTKIWRLRSLSFYSEGFILTVS